jgi:hypothetical protein
MRERTAQSSPPQHVLLADRDHPPRSNEWQAQRINAERPPDQHETDSNQQRLPTKSLKADSSDGHSDQKED